MGEIQLKVPFECPECGFKKDYTVEAIPHEEDPNAFAVRIICFKCNTPTTMLVTQQFVNAHLYEQKD